ncbi:MAG: P-type conjugative transfer protein TrbG [Gammaproteobacteria bacterium]|nr:P-type conjugative transfer protein TrbG [Gammaproteobacteria bacterium]MCP4386996.1 P-type conjugative transfer protein TrbG [Gammaproteobacteria bacterium]MCP5093585.1 P-type conjugative transfer protein TrbG [Gammaproteobacteria bacterium]
MRATTLAYLALIAVTLLGGCATQPRNFSTDDTLAYQEAIRAEQKAAEPIAVKETVTVPSPGQLRPEPHITHTHPDKRPPHRVIDDANAKARQLPNRDGYYNAVMTFDYDEGALYRIYTAPLRQTDIMLQPGERMISQPGGGDTTRWKIGSAISQLDGVEQQHLLVKATRPNIYTNLTIFTDRRTYHVELESYKETYMAAVNWNYPNDSWKAYNAKLTKTRENNDAVDAARIDLSNANFAYEINIKEGNPEWKPLRVFDNGRKTYVQFPNIVGVTDVPVLYVKKYGTQQIVNYRTSGRYFIVDGVFPRYELRVGVKDNFDVVEIINTDRT